MILDFHVKVLFRKMTQPSAQSPMLQSFCTTLKLRQRFRLQRGRFLLCCQHFYICVGWLDSLISKESSWTLQADTEPEEQRIFKQQNCSVGTCRCLSETLRFWCCFIFKFLSSLNRLDLTTGLKAACYFNCTDDSDH